MSEDQLSDAGKLMHDSGKRQEFEGGAVRDTADGKPKMDFLSPWVWTLLADPDTTEHEVCQYVCDYLLDHRVELIQSALEAMIRKYGVERLCAWLELGAQKYEPFNWAKGMPVSRCIASLGRHVLKIKQDDEDHPAAMMCNLMFIMHYHKAVREGYLPKKWFDLFQFNREKAF